MDYEIDFAALGFAAPYGSENCHSTTIDAAAACCHGDYGAGCCTSCDLAASHDVLGGFHGNGGNMVLGTGDHDDDENQDDLAAVPTVLRNDTVEELLGLIDRRSRAIAAAAGPGTTSTTHCCSDTSMIDVSLFSSQSNNERSAMGGGIGSGPDVAALELLDMRSSVDGGGKGDRMGISRSSDDGGGDSSSRNQNLFFDIRMLMESESQNTKKTNQFPCQNPFSMDADLIRTQMIKSSSSSSIGIQSNNSEKETDLGIEKKVDSTSLLEDLTSSHFVDFKNDAKLNPFSIGILEGSICPPKKQVKKLKIVSNNSRSEKAKSKQKNQEIEISQKSVNDKKKGSLAKKSRKKAAKTKSQNNESEGEKNNEVDYKNEANKASSESSRYIGLEATKKLESWYENHIDYPYPTREEISNLCTITNLAKYRVLSWLSNKRNRNHNTMPKKSKKVFQSSFKSLVNKIRQEITLIDNLSGAQSSTHKILNWIDELETLESSYDQESNTQKTVAESVRNTSSASKSKQILISKTKKSKSTSLTHDSEQTSNGSILTDE